MIGSNKRKGIIGGLPIVAAATLTYLSVSISWSQAISEEGNWLSTNRSLRVGIAPAWAPFEYFDDDNGPSGITSDYVRILNEQLGLRMAAVPGLTWDEILKGARAGNIDVITAIMATTERSEFLSFTEPYLRLRLVVVAGKDSPHIDNLQDLRGKTVAVVKGYGTQGFIENDVPGQELMLVDRMDEAFQVVSDGWADATVGVLAVGEFFERKLNLPNLKVAAITPYEVEISIGVRKGLAPLVPILNKALSRFTEQEKS